MSKIPITPRPDDEDENNQLTQRDKQTAEDILAGLEHPEKNLFGDPNYMGETEDHEQLTENDIPTVCMRCKLIVDFCICQ